MKILIIINNLGVGGAERLVIDDINEMLDRGIEVKLLTLKLENPSRTLSNECNIAESDWIKLDFGSLLNIRSWSKVISIIKSFKPDVVITHLWYSNVIGRIAAKISGIKKVIAFEHNVYDNLKTWKMFFIDRMLQSFSSPIVAVSNAVKESLLRHGISEKRIKVIRNGIDIEKYKNLAESVGNNEKKAEFTFIFIGRLIEQKGVDILLKAFSKIKEAKLLIVGNGKEEENLKNLSKKLGISEKVNFLGTRKDIPNLLHTSDCFVLPSRYEGLPMVLLEAVAAKKIIIVSDFESAREVITDGDNGIIVPKENIEKLAEAMENIKSNQALGERLKSNIQKHLVEVSIKNHIDEILKI